ASTFVVHASESTGAPSQSRIALACTPLDATGTRSRWMFPIHAVRSYSLFGFLVSSMKRLLIRIACIPGESVAVYWSTCALVALTLVTSTSWCALSIPRSTSTVHVPLVQPASGVANAVIERTYVPPIVIGIASATISLGCAGRFGRMPQNPVDAFCCHH